MELLKTIFESFADTIGKMAQNSGFMTGSWQQFIMIGIACLLLFLAIVKKFEPLLLLPIAFGMLLSNIPMGGVINMNLYDPQFIAEIGRAHV